MSVDWKLVIDTRNAPEQADFWAGALGYEVEDPAGFWEAPVILPKRFRYLALKAYERGIVSVSKLAELLRENVFELRGKLEAVHQSGQATADAT